MAKEDEKNVAIAALENVIQATKELQKNYEELHDVLDTVEEDMASIEISPEIAKAFREVIEAGRNANV